MFPKDLQGICMWKITAVLIIQEKKTLNLKICSRMWVSLLIKVEKGLANFDLLLNSSSNVIQKENPKGNRDSLKSITNSLKLLR